jgi:hypothetical protein
MANAPKSKLPTEPVNSEQLDAMMEQAPAATTSGEVEEKIAEAELRAEGAERRAEALASELETLKAQVAVLMRAARTPQARPDIVLEAGRVVGPEPVFDENEPYGTVVGDPSIGFVQGGHQFDLSRKYVATEVNRGCARPFNPRLVGLTKPRPGQTLSDALAGIRDQNDR